MSQAGSHNIFNFQNTHQYRLLVETSTFIIIMIFSYVSKFHHYERFLSQIHCPFLHYERSIRYWCHNLVRMDQIREDMKLLFIQSCANICERLLVSFGRLPVL